MSDDVLLTDLCSICHVNPIKYTCPRCGTHTCSLPCVRKHKLWAQCSGIRDPAEYRKRSELATDSSVDKDFNFISKVERSLDSADNNVQERGLILAPARFIHPNAHRPKHETEIEERGVIIQRAPKGLSRSKQNKTHWANQHKCIMWTIEWIFQDGEKIVGQGLETRKIGDAFVHAVGKKNINKKRKRDGVEKENERRGEQKVVQREDYTPNSLDNSKEQTEQATGTSGNEARQEQNTTDKSDEEGRQEEQTIHKSNNETEQADTTNRTGRVDATNHHNDELLTGLHFYLHRPNTMANMRCLVPLDRQSSLQEVLPGRTVLEFPTIYVRNESPKDLSPPFVLESKYLERYGKDIPINLVSNTEDGELIDDSLPTIDEKKVLEVLAKDLKG